MSNYRADDADYLIVGQGSLIPSAEAVADYLRETRKIKVGVVNLTMFRPFPGARSAGCSRAGKAWRCWSAWTSPWQPTCR